MRKWIMRLIKLASCMASMRVLDAGMEGMKIENRLREMDGHRPTFCAPVFEEFAQRYHKLAIEIADLHPANEKVLRMKSRAKTLMEKP